MAEKSRKTNKIEECNCYNGNMPQALKVTQSLLKKYSKILKQQLCTDLLHTSAGQCQYPYRLVIEFTSFHSNSSVHFPSTKSYQNIRYKCIISEGRTGSSHPSHLLRKHPHFQEFGENDREDQIQFTELNRRVKI